MKERLFSGCAPSGCLTLGNYLGALRSWSENQDKYDSIFSVVDMHALTVPRTPEGLRSRSMDFLCLYMACGIDPEKSTLFIQSHNPRHSELAWILGCLTNFGELGRMTQFKGKSRKSGANAGLLTYPVLMAADILLYGARFVSVGEDQKQHLELTRDLAVRFNKRYGEIFPLPEPFIPSRTGRIMNLLDPGSKMDKSHGNPGTYIALLDPPEVIEKKIARAVTDSSGTFDLDDEGSGIGNLVRIYSALTGLGEGTVVWEYENRGYGAFKKDLGEIIADFLTPVREKYTDIRQNESLLENLILLGRDKALDKSEALMKEVKYAVGLLI